MKKVLFLMLFLLVLKAANVSAQVRIGGDGEPYAAAILDLNADDSDTPTENKGALALPRVNLDDNTAQLNSADPITGMLVYNTNEYMAGGNGVGVYFYDGNYWVLISGDGIMENAVTNATTDGGLILDGSGTPTEPYTLGIANNGIRTQHIADKAVTVQKMSVTHVNATYTGLGNAAGSTGTATLPSMCNPDYTLYTFSAYGIVTAQTSGSGVQFYRHTTSGTPAVNIRYWCFN